MRQDDRIDRMTGLCCSSCVAPRAALSCLPSWRLGVLARKGRIRGEETSRKGAKHAKLGVLWVATVPPKAGLGEQAPPPQGGSWATALQGPLPLGVGRLHARWRKLASAGCGRGRRQEGSTAMASHNRASLCREAVRGGCPGERGDAVQKTPRYVQLNS